MKNQKSILILVIIGLLLLPHTLALQQTVGPVNLTVEQGNTTTSKYGIRNDENNSITVSFNVTGNASQYLFYEKNITLEPNEFRYVNITSTIPSNYTGNNTLTGIIYALKEGKSGGQVQINIQLGKYINLNIIKPKMTSAIYQSNTTNISNQSKNAEHRKVDGYMPSIMFISVLVILTIAMKYRKRKQNK